MKRIVVIGLSGSGKSTFAQKLSNKLKIPIVHLDMEYFNSDWSEKFSKEDWTAHHDKLVQKNEWIIDGTYRNTIDKRVERADTIFYFDIPKLICFYRVFKRALTNKGASEKPREMREKADKALVKYMLSYSRKSILSKIYSKKNKEVYIFKSNAQAENFLNNLAINS